MFDQTPASAQGQFRSERMFRREQNATVEAGTRPRDRLVRGLPFEGGETEVPNHYTTSLSNL